jgi:hypothetical protein
MGETFSAGAVDTGAEPIISPIARRVGIEYAALLPPTVHLPPRGIVDQKDLDCCVSCGLAACAEILYGEPPLAPLYHYYTVRGGVLAGMTVEEGGAALARDGICHLPLHPAAYTAEGAAIAPSADAFTDAARLLESRIRASTSLFGPLEPLIDPQREVQWKRTLTEGRPLLIEFELTPPYGPTMRRLQPTGDGTGRLHAVVVIGYEDAQQAFIVQDSRGPGFAIGGQWWLPYDVALTRLVRQAFALRPPRWS